MVCDILLLGKLFGFECWNVFYVLSVVAYHEYSALHLQDVVQMPTTPGMCYNLNTQHIEFVDVYGTSILSDKCASSDCMIGVSGWMFLLVPAHMGCPGQNTESHKYHFRDDSDSNLIWMTDYFRRAPLRQSLGCFSSIISLLHVSYQSSWMSNEWNTVYNVPRRDNG